MDVVKEVKICILTLMREKMLLENLCHINILCNIYSLNEIIFYRNTGFRGVNNIIQWGTYCINHCF